MTVQVPWVKLPKTPFEQLKNGAAAVIFKLSPEYVAKILYAYDGKDYSLRNDTKSLDEIMHEANVCEILYNRGIGNVPKPIGVERLGLYGTSYPAFIMEYLTIPRADELNLYNLGIATNLAIEELGKAIDIGLVAGNDALAPANFFYDEKQNKVRLIDFGRWLNEMKEENKNGFSCSNGCN